MTYAEVDVIDNPDLNRFEAWVDGDLAGRAHYRQRDGRVVFTHTEVDDAYEGRGIGSRLARGALDSVRAGGHKAVPMCPFIDSYIRRHEEYTDLVDWGKGSTDA